ncbi:hypothetical protein PQQ51_02565 [Paraburkholderia xenovorans]|uniref:hypothetical protein n=1 Tax=Paraburkholderia xenovorans TaxID=36873 RepID=UPI0038B802CA
MHHEARKVVFTGFIVGALAVAAYVAQSDKRWLSADDNGLERGDVSVHHTRGDTITGAVSSAPVVTHHDSGDTLQAARNSLQRNDLAAAQAQLDAMRSVHSNDVQVQALQQEVTARAGAAQHPAAAVAAARSARRGPTAVIAEKATSTQKVLRSSSLATREPANSALASASSQRDPIAAFADASPSGEQDGAAKAASTPSSGSATLKVVSRVSGVSDAAPVAQTPPSRTQTELTAQAAAPPSAQAAPPIAPLETSSGTVVKTDGGPKTREQVRAEIVRARNDGSLPAFGNPDPAGPGGAPSLAIAPRP